MHARRASMRVARAYRCCASLPRLLLHEELVINPWRFTVVSSRVSLHGGGGPQGR